MRKRTLCLLLVFVMLMSLVPMGIPAEESEENTGFTENAATDVPEEAVTGEAVTEEEVGALPAEPEADVEELAEIAAPETVKAASKFSGGSGTAKDPYFVNQIIEYIVHNGVMRDLSVLQDAPFTDNGSIVEVFTDLSVWLGIKKIIDSINANAVAA